MDYIIPNVSEVNDTFSDDSPLEISVPEGSILGPLLFILYTEGLQDLANKYNFSIHEYADETQMYFQCNPRKPSVHLSRLKQCFADIMQWMSRNYLNMNDSKTEIVSNYIHLTPVQLPLTLWILMAAASSYQTKLKIWDSGSIKVCISTSR
jgi:hypothetical protein